MANNKIEFTIDAKNNASKALDTVSVSLAKTGTSAKNTSVQVASAFQKVADSVPKIEMTDRELLKLMHSMKKTDSVGKVALSKVKSGVNSVKNAMKGAVPAAKKLEKAIDSIGGVAKTFLKILGAIIAGPASIVAFTTVVAGAVRETKTLSVTAGLAVNEFNGLAHAANQFKVSNEKLSDVLKDVNDKVGDFLATGGGPLRDFFVNIGPKVGVTAEQFKNLSSKDALQLYVSSLEKANVSQAQMTFYMEAIANDATKLIPLFANQGAAMKAAANDAEFLGITMSETLVKKSDNLKNGMDRAGKAVKGMGFAISEELMPFITPVANAFANMVARVRKDTAGLVNSIINAFFGMGAIIDTFGKKLYEFFTGGEIFQSWIDSMVNLSTNTGAAFLHMGEMIVRLIRQAFSSSSDIISTFAGWAFDKIKGIFTDNPTEGFVEKMGATVSQAMKAMGAITDEKFQQIKANGEGINEVYTNVFEGMKEGFTETYALGLEKANEMRQVILDNKAIDDEGEIASTEQKLGFIEQLKGGWKLFYDDLGKQNQIVDKQFAGLMKNTIKGFSGAFAKAVVEGKSLTDSMKDFTKQILTGIIEMYVQMGIQRLITGNIIEMQTIKEAAVSFAKIGSEVFGNVYSSISAIPIVGPVLAPAAAIGAAAFVGSKMGIAHGGLDNVPRESTYLLDKGERVLSPNQNRDLTGFLSSANDGGGGGRSINIENLNVEVLPNATNADALLALDPNEMKEIVAGPIIAALNELDNEGVRPNFIERMAV